MHLEDIIKREHKSEQYLGTYKRCSKTSFAYSAVAQSLSKLTLNIAYLSISDSSTSLFNGCAQSIYEYIWKGSIAIYRRFDIAPRKKNPADWAQGILVAMVTVVRSLRWRAREKHSLDIPAPVLNYGAGQIFHFAIGRGIFLPSNFHRWKWVPKRCPFKMPAPTLIRSGYWLCPG